METVITLSLARKSTLVGELAGELRRFGMSFERHSVYGCQADRCRVVIYAEGSPAQVDELSDRLLAIDGVFAVIDIRVERAARRAFPQVSKQASKIELAANQILWAYPRIRSLVEDFGDTQLPAEREHWLMKLGVLVGERMGEYHPKLASASDVATALEMAVVPALKSVAVATPFGSDLRITDNIFLRRNLDMLLLPISDQPRGCFFIAGLIQGMVNKAPQLPHLCVTETKCQELGDPACYYEINDQ